MFKRSLRKVSSEEDNEDEDEEEGGGDDDNTEYFGEFEDQCPGSPGLKIMLEEEKQE